MKIKGIGKDLHPKGQEDWSRFTFDLSAGLYLWPSVQLFRDHIRLSRALNVRSRLEEQRHESLEHWCGLNHRWILHQRSNQQWIQENQEYDRWTGIQDVIETWMPRFSEAPMISVVLHESLAERIAHVYISYITFLLNLWMNRKVSWDVKDVFIVQPPCGNRNNSGWHLFANCFFASACLRGSSISH